MHILLEHTVLGACTSIISQDGVQYRNFSKVCCAKLSDVSARRPTFQVEDKPLANNVAYTTGTLSVHTDYPAMSSPPGVSPASSDPRPPARMLS